MSSTHNSSDLWWMFPAEGFLFPLISRKAFRLGKFLQDVNSFRRSQATGPIYLLEVLAYGGSWEAGVPALQFAYCIPYCMQSSPVRMLSHTSVVLQEERACTTS